MTHLSYDYWVASKDFDGLVHQGHGRDVPLIVMIMCMSSLIASII